jgi:hypothetical protein
VSGIRATVIDENMEIFRRLFIAPPEKASDPYWKRALTLFNSLSEPDRNVLLEIVRNTAVATTAHLLGVLDGENPISVENCEIKLLAADGQQLSGELQTTFLLEEERRAP